MDAGSTDGPEKGSMANEEKIITPVSVTLTLDELKELVAAGRGNGLAAEDLKAILESQQKTQQQMVEQTRQVRHSNPDHPHISAFSYPEGDLKHPKPTLARRTYFNGHREREEDLTPEEIEAYNSITQTCSAREGTWTAVVKRDRLVINVPSYTIDDRMNLPTGLVLILRELCHGKKAVTLADMALEIAELKRQLAARGEPLIVPATT